jgi:large subunit ribosomal protein L1
MKSKRLQEIEKIVGEKNPTNLDNAIDILKKCPPVKFDQSITVTLTLGIDPKRADQQVRGTVSLPHGTGKTIKVVVLAKGDKVKEAQDAGADFAGSEEIVEKITGGWLDFDCLIATPDMMREVGKLGKVLGPRGLMPSPKAGTVTTDVAKTIKEIKAGKVEYKIDKTGVIANVVGKLSFTKDKLVDNAKTFLSAVSKARPSTAKGIFITKVYIASSMGPGIPIDLQTLEL